MLAWAQRGVPRRRGNRVFPSQGQAQECLLEKSMLDNRKSFLVARISAQVSSRPVSAALSSGSGGKGWHPEGPWQA